jgi:hypothetical protein
MRKNQAVQGLQSALTPGMLGTGGADPANDPLGLALHQRALEHEDEFYRQQHEADRQPGADPQQVFAHQTNEGRSRINNMNAGGMGDWLYAFNEATGGKGRFAPGTKFTDAPQQTYDPSFQTSAVDPNDTVVHRGVIDRRNNPQYYGGEADPRRATNPALDALRRMF